MDASVLPGAAILLDFISEKESGGHYDVIIGNHQGSLTKPITSMTMQELASAQHAWAKKWGSSAAGRYQEMSGTIASLPTLWRPTDHFTPDLQDRIAYALLKRRGYAEFMARKMATVEFGRRLAMEWASLPMLADGQGAHGHVKRGHSYYDGDGKNAALVTPEKVEAVLALVHAASA